MKTKSKYIGQRVGTVEVCANAMTPGGKPALLTHRRQYEFAAWSTDLEALPGVYPLYVGFNEYGPLYHCTTLYSVVSAIIRDDNCAPHFGGVAFAPARKDRVGTDDEFNQTFDFLAVLLAVRPGNGRWPDERGLKFTINAAFLPQLAQEVFEQCDQEIEYLTKCVDEQRAQHKWSMVAHYARLLENLTRALEYGRQSLPLILATEVKP